MEVLYLIDHLLLLFGDRSLFGFVKNGEELTRKTGCQSAIVTLMPYPDLRYMYDPVEYSDMLEVLYKAHSAKIAQLREFLDSHHVRWASAPATPQVDLHAEFSYKWAAVHAGLGFIGKNDVFVHEKYGQRVRITSLLVDMPLPVYEGELISKCGSCEACVKACPHSLITGRIWHVDIKRDELVDYQRCAKKCGEMEEGACAHCLLACQYPDI